jgi:hypothetical protein
MDGVALDDLAPNRIMVGWLAAKSPYAKGPVDRAFFVRLLELLAEPWQPFACAGRHPCEFCRFTGGPSRVSCEGREAAVGIGDLYVPFEETLYVAPSLVAHYVDAHDFAPPPEFVTAVMRCPPMRSMAYLQALRRAGVRTKPAERP